ncbi:hypothetical protein [Mycolicibacterium austroafricanum]|uniref:hypothetical protein n=1 Tax=Mycolicibacterium austroafricanum TaxID=39687 RepID=UPI001ABF04AA|nr:hypothetical protein [Mycolicibacterium austroafricanum]QRZ05914.1 hypothetical protein JN090_23800 [Mycolicibacterium austroafricanum]
MSSVADVIKSAVEGSVAVFYPCECGEHESGYEHFVDQLSRSLQEWRADRAKPTPEQQLVAAVQDVVLNACNGIGAALLGDAFAPLTESPISDAELVRMFQKATDTPVLSFLNEYQQEKKQ